MCLPHSVLFLYRNYQYLVIMSSSSSRLSMSTCIHKTGIPDSKVHGANMGPIWGRQDPRGPHVGPMNLAMWDCLGVIFKGDKITYSIETCIRGSGNPAWPREWVWQLTPSISSFNVYDYMFDWQLQNSVCEQDCSLQFVLNCQWIISVVKEI